MSTSPSYAKVFIFPLIVERVQFSVLTSPAPSPAPNAIPFLHPYPLPLPCRGQHSSSPTVTTSPPSF
eukprot:752520-Hanusia_phi.AAC.3